jgi:hypothetical protein
LLHTKWFLTFFCLIQGLQLGVFRGSGGDNFSGSYQDLNPHHVAQALSVSKKQTETKRVEMQCFVNNCHVCVMYPAGSMVLPVPVSMIDQYHKPFEGEHVNRTLNTHEGWLFKTTPDRRERLSQRAPDCTVRNIPLNARESSSLEITRTRESGYSGGIRVWDRKYSARHSQKFVCPRRRKQESVVTVLAAGCSTKGVLSRLIEVSCARRRERKRAVTVMVPDCSTEQLCIKLIEGCSPKTT